MTSLKLIFLYTIPILFVSSCDNKPEKEVALIPIINLYGKPIDTAYLNTNYQDPQAFLTTYDPKGEYPKVTGRVNTSVLGTYYIDYDYTNDQGQMSATITRTVYVVDINQVNEKGKQGLWVYKKTDGSTLDTIYKNGIPQNK